MDTQHQRNNVIFYVRIVAALTFAILTLFSCQREQVVVDSPFELVSISSTQEVDTDQLEVIETVERLLFAAGNYNLEDLDSMISDKAMLGINSLDNGVWTNSEMTIDAYFENVRIKDLRPHCELFRTMKLWSLKVVWLWSGSMRFCTDLNTSNPGDQ